MPQSSEPISDKDLRAFIDSQDDFGFEREVYHKANGLGLTAFHAGLYEDPVTNKPRQFDIRASKTTGRFRIDLTIECKGLVPTYPLLVSCVPRTRAESFHDALHTDRVAGVRGSFTRVHTFRGARSLYREGQAVGKSMRQIRRDNRGELTGGDDVFDKWMQALASAAELLSDAASLLSTPGTGKPQFAAVLPVLVVSDDTLWVADYASNGRLNRDPFKVTDITFYLGRKYVLPVEQLTFTISHLHVYTRGHVHTLFEQVGKGGGTWEELFDEQP